MFTGIVEALGTVAGTGTTVAIRVPRSWGKIKKGASIAVNGACLTVVGTRGDACLTFNIVSETRRRTNLGRLRTGDRVNLERPLKWGGRIEGHYVLGHVDGTGRVLRIQSSGRQKSLLISCPAPMRRWLVEKGSITVDGVSLTVGRVSRGAFWVHLIPHTLKMTRFGALKAGDRVNLEADLAAKLALKRRKG